MITKLKSIFTVSDYEIRLSKWVVIVGYTYQKYFVINYSCCMDWSQLLIVS